MACGRTRERLWRELCSPGSGAEQGLGQRLLPKWKLASSRDPFKYDSSEHMFYPESSDRHGEDVGGREFGEIRSSLDVCIPEKKMKEL